MALPDGVTEHLSAKACRFNSWSDKVAYTRYWPMVTHHLLGDQNDISHILSHLGEETRARHDHFTSTGSPVLACPATVHSFHGPPDPDADPLSPYELTHLNLTAPDAAEMQRAYLEDDTQVLSVPLSDVYKVITGHPTQSLVSTLHRECINTWRNKRCFSVPSPEGHTKLLFAPLGATVYKDPDVGDDATDVTHQLVTAVLTGARVKVTDAESVIDPSDDADGQHYADHDLRRDLLIHCHNNSDHPGLSNTNIQVRALC